MKLEPSITGRLTATYDWRQSHILRLETEQDRVQKVNDRAWATMQGRLKGYA